MDQYRLSELIVTNRVVPHLFSHLHHCQIPFPNKDDYLFSFLAGFDGGGGGAFTGLGGPTDVAVGLGPGSGGEVEAGPGLEEPMNLTKAVWALFFLAGGVPAGTCSTSIVAGLDVSDSTELIK